MYYLQPALRVSDAPRFLLANGKAVSWFTTTFLASFWAPTPKNLGTYPQIVIITLRWGEKNEWKV